MSYSSYDHDDLEPASTMRIERRIYFESGKADLSEAVKLPLAELLSLRAESAAAEQEVFDRLKEQAAAWEEQAGRTLFLDKALEYMIQDSIYLKNYARIYGKAIFHAATLREIQLYYSMLNFVNDTESEVRLDYLKQFCITDDDIELIAPLPENQNYIDFMFEIASHGKNEEILMAVLPCMLSYSYIFRKLASVPTSRESRYWDFIKDYADEQYAESCKEWSAFAEHKCAGLSEANKKYLADIFEKASLLELAFWKMAYRNERMEENAK